MIKSRQDSPQGDGRYMTAEQFDNHLAPLMGRHDGSRRRCALRLVLVEGYSATKAAEKAEIHHSAITHALREAREAMAHVHALQYPAVRLPAKRGSNKVGKELSSHAVDA